MFREVVMGSEPDKKIERNGPKLGRPTDPDYLPGK